MTQDTTSQRRYLVRAINAPIHAAAFKPCADDGLTTALHHTTRYAQLIIPKRLVTHPFAIGAEVAERLPRHVIRFTMSNIASSSASMSPNFSSLTFAFAHCLVKSFSCP